jgi:hypothetical protein
MTIENDPTVVNSGVRYARLGYLTWFESGYTVTVGDRIGGDKRAAKLTPPYHRLLSSLDPTVDDREFAAGELRLLEWLAGQGLVALVPADAALEDLTMIPVPRRDMAFVEDLDYGCLLQVVDGEPFVISKVGAQFIPFFDGDRTLGEIAEIVKLEILFNPEKRGTVEQIEKDQGRSFDSVLVEEALVLIRDFAPSQAITFEPLQYDLAVVNLGVRYVLLGFLTPSESGSTLTVGDRAGGEKREAELTPAHHRLVSSLDPTVDDRKFAAEELGLLGWLAARGFLALVQADAGLEDLTMIPVVRREVVTVEDLDRGYLLRAGDGEPFAVSDLGARFLPLMDGERTLGQIAEIVKNQILAAPADRVLVEQEEEREARSFDSFLMEKALVLIRDLPKSQAITFEPTA